MKTILIVVAVLGSVSAASAAIRSHAESALSGQPIFGAALGPDGVTKKGGGR